MAICDREKMRILQIAEVRHRDPAVLVDLVRVGGRLACFSCEGEFSYAVGEHLLRVRSVVTVLEAGEGTLRQRVQQLGRLITL